MIRNRFIVTGAAGFLGLALCKKLKSLGYEVVAIARRKSSALDTLHIPTQILNLTDSNDTALHLSGADGVFHVASKVEPHGDFLDFEQSNVLATQNVIKACIANKIQRLVYTSTPSVVSNLRDRVNINEDFPYPTQFFSPYAATKAKAEQLILRANSQQLYTTSLRPHMIWGPGDKYWIPTILKYARTGKLFQVGNGKNLVGATHLDDAVDAHILAMDALSANPKSRGNAYFIRQEDPLNFWDGIKSLLDHHGLPGPKAALPRCLCMVAGYIFELQDKFNSSHRMPLITRHLASELSSHHYGSIERAKRDLGFSPKKHILELLTKSASMSQIDIT